MSMVRVTMPAPNRNRLIVAVRAVPDEWGRNVQTRTFEAWCDANAAGWGYVIMGHQEWSRWRPDSTLAHAYTLDRLTG